MEIFAWVKKLVELATQYKEPLDVLAAALTILTALIGLIGIPVAAIKWFAGRQTKPKKHDLQLSDPPHAENSLSRFTTQAVEVLGRKQEETRLRDFLQSQGNFAWMQIAGVGGQGKSRLAFELMLWARDRNWKAGWLDASEIKAFAEHWDSWQPQQYVLLIVDYVIGQEPGVKLVIQTLSRRKDELRYPVRLLLLERQRWDRGGLRRAERSTADGVGSVSEGRAEWFLKLTERFDGNDSLIAASRFGDGVIELEQLSEAHLVDIVRQVADRVGVDIPMADKAIAEKLNHIDSAGRPLYAYFFGQVLAFGLDTSSGGSGYGWQRDSMLDAILDRDRRSRWQQVLGKGAPCLGDNSPAERIAIIATIVGGLNCVEAERKGVIPHADGDTRCRALVLTDGPQGGNTTGPAQFIPALQPDLLGEWFVLSAIDQGLRGEELLNLAWRCAPKQTAAFLQRLSEDFPGHTVTTELLGKEPPDDQALNALADVSSTILYNLSEARCSFPAPVVGALNHAANGGDAAAMYNLGVCYARGEGVAANPATAVEWYEKAAAAGHAAAMYNLGVCYARGEGVAANPATAAEWYQKAAAAGYDKAK